MIITGTSTDFGIIFRTFAGRIIGITFAFTKFAIFINIHIDTADALEGGRKTAKAAAIENTDTAELSFMCSIVLFIFGLLPKQACLTRSIVIIVPKLTRCSFLFLEQHSTQNG